MNTEKDRLTLGHHACPKALRELPARLRGLEEKPPIRLTLPPVTPPLVPFLEETLAIAETFSDVETAANDWGTLARLSEWKKNRAPSFKLILGALLSGQDTDPVLRLFLEPQPDTMVHSGQETVALRWSPPPMPLTLHWATPSAFHWTALLTEMGVDKIELGLQPLPLPDLHDHLPVASYPFGVLSVRPCCGDCAACGGPDKRRAGCRLFFDRNLLLWEPL